MNGGGAEEAARHLATVDARIAEMRARAKQQPRQFWSLSGLLDAYRSLVEEIRSGYALTIDDYTGK